MKESRYVLIGFIFTLVFCIAILPTSILADNSYKPYLYDPVVPEEGAIESIGSYDTKLFQGAADYVYTIETPPGTNDLQPAISLSFNHLLQKSTPTTTGSAWDITKNYVQRKTNYTILDTTDDWYELYLNNQRYKLVYVSSEDQYHTNPETFLKITFEEGGANENNNYWLIINKDGEQFRYGYNSDSELVSNQEDFTWRWSLDLINDSHGNNIYYEYNEDPYINDIGSVYLDSITYNNDEDREVNFIYESTDRDDIRSTYVDGHFMQVSRLLQEIEVKSENNLVRKYDIDYQTNGANSQNFIDQLVLFGDDGITTMPEIGFSYVEENVDGASCDLCSGRIVNVWNLDASNLVWKSVLEEGEWLVFYV